MAAPVTQIPVFTQPYIQPTIPTTVFVPVPQKTILILPPRETMAQETDTAPPGRNGKEASIPGEEVVDVIDSDKTNWTPIIIAVIVIFLLMKSK